jgi:hypothetical protein
VFEDSAVAVRVTVLSAVVAVALAVSFAANGTSIWAAIASGAFVAGLCAVVLIAFVRRNR